MYIGTYPVDVLAILTKTTWNAKLFGLNNLLLRGPIHNCHIEYEFVVLSV